MPRTILVVDDNEINRKILRRILADDYTIIEAENGQVAIERLAAAKRDISAVLLDLVMPIMDGYQVLDAMAKDAELSQIPVIVATGASELDAERRALSMGANDFVFKPFDADIIKHRLHNLIRLRETAAMVNTLRRDDVTGLLLRKFFFEQAAEMIARHEPGHYVMAAFDVNNFKLVNDRYGTEKGDEVLRQIARVFLDGFSASGGLSCRIMADNFAVLYPASFMGGPELKEIRRRAAVLDGSILPLTLNVGRYIVDDLSIPVSGMYDRAVLAQLSVKGRYDVPYAMYDESMRTRLLDEQLLIGEKDAALSGGQFEVWFQPQYNHSSGALVGAEALVRWRHPSRGVISPAAFIPVFERIGFIYELDKYIWEQTCAYLKRWVEQGRSPLPVSVNISRYDILQGDVVDVLCGLVRSYGIPVELLRLEVTESAFSSSTERIISVVRGLLDSGFTVEIDDFGSGYSSLNTLKDVPAQIVKLDMRFLDNIGGNDRGGNIVESVVRMVKWLGMSVIAEGVETVEQADYLVSIGCCYVQGYLYSRPVPVEEYEALAGSGVKEPELIVAETVENLDNNTFWDPTSMDTLIFNSYVGGACIVEYQNGKVELLRINRKFAEALSAYRFSMEDALRVKLSEHMDAANSRKLVDAIARAASSGEEISEEVCFTALDGSGELNYARFTARAIARAGSRHLVYAAVANTSAQRQAERKERQAAARLQTIMANMYGGVSAVSMTGDDVSFIFANDRYYEILGYTRQQFHSELASAFDVVHPDDKERIRDEVNGVLSSGRRAVYEYRCLKRDGELVWLRCSASVSEMDGVEGRVLLSVITDITEVALANAALSETDEQLRFLNETAGELLAQPEIGKGISRVLRKVLDYFSGSRSCIVELSSPDRSRVSYEACAEGIPSEMAQAQSMPRSAYSFLWSAIERGEPVRVDSLDELEGDGALARRYFEAQGIRSFIAVPLRREGVVIGFIGVDNPTRHRGHVSQLMALGDYIAVMLTRRDMRRLLEKRRQETAQTANDPPRSRTRSN